jgi:hypothetical protein
LFMGGHQLREQYKEAVQIFTNQPISAHFPHTYTAFLNLFSGSCTTQSPMQATIRELVKPFNHNTYHKCDIIQFFLKFYFVLNRHISPYSKNIHYNPMIDVFCSLRLLIRSHYPKSFLTIWDHLIVVIQKQGTGTWHITPSVLKIYNAGPVGHHTCSVTLLWYMADKC